MLKGFKEFILRGNVVDLAVAVVIGAAFTTVVNSLVEKVFNPLIGALFQADSLDNALNLVIPGMDGAEATLQFGAFIGALLQFVIVAAVVYFVFVVPVNHFKKRAEALLTTKKADEAEAPAVATELELLAEIRDLLARQKATGAHAAPTDTP